MSQPLEDVKHSIEGRYLVQTRVVGPDSSGGFWWEGTVIDSQPPGGSKQGIVAQNGNKNLKYEDAIQAADTFRAEQVSRIRKARQIGQNPYP